MNTIVVSTQINAPIERCFKLSTSIDLHKISASKSQEEAIGGVTTGLIKLNDTVIWKAKHFGIWHKMSVRITEYEEPSYFVDEMINGSFKEMRHKHEFFSTSNSGTLMKDTFQFSSPFGFIGRFLDQVILTKYMTNFLLERNETIRRFAETERWKGVLDF